LERARTLARRPDVTALMALREDVVLRARERGIAGSSSVKSELNELDRRLTEARTLQLKLDAEEFRKADSKPPR
jgi:citrate lyase beta subunit